MDILIFTLIGAIVGALSNVLGERGRKMSLAMGDILFGIAGSLVSGLIWTLKNEESGVSPYIIAFIGGSMAVLLLRVFRAWIVKRKR